MTTRSMFLVLFLAATALVAQASAKATLGVPQLLHFQGQLTDLLGVPLSDGNHDLTVRIYDAEAGGGLLWAETQSVSVLGGIFSATLGELTSMASVNFDQHLWVSVEPDFGGELAPRIALTSTPYSLVARDVSNGVAVRSLNGLTEDISLLAGTGKASR